MAPAQLSFDLTGVPIDLMLWGLLAVAVIVYTIFSAILLWHWKLYSTHRFTAVASMLGYLSVGFSLLLLMALAAAWYTFA